MNDNFNRLGANAISIRPLSETIQTNRRGKNEKPGSAITFEQALRFKNDFKYSGSLVSVEAWCESNATIKYMDKKTNPTVVVRGIDENNLSVSSYELELGRSFTASEALSMTNRVVIGSEIVKLLFNEKADKALGQDISINGDIFKVIGILKEKGAASGGNSDRRVLIPLLTAKAKYGFADKNYNVSIATMHTDEVAASIEKAIGLMRLIRNLGPGDANDFEIRKSDSILATLKEMTATLRWSTIIIALLTLLGAAIGLMNIMLVTVTERTKEIGVRKALGATSRNVLIQFLTEAIVICLLGGIVGIILGIGLGFGVSLLIQGSFVIPWLWMTLGLVVCIFVGLFSGLYPAMKASKLDPIESLRYE